MGESDVAKEEEVFEQWGYRILPEFGGKDASGERFMCMGIEEMTWRQLRGGWSSLETSHTEEGEMRRKITHFVRVYI